MSSSFPSSIDTFTTYLDVNSTDATLLKNYQEAKQAGNETLANQYLVQITNYAQKVVTADKLNKQNDALIAIETFYGTDIQPYITTKQAEWQGIIDRFGYKLRYNSTTTYVQNNIVLYDSGSGDCLYLCTTTPPSSNYAPTNTTYWRVFTVKGAKGNSSGSISTVFMGDWISSENYPLNSIVIYGYNWWYCTQANTNQTPQDSSDYWDIIMPTVQNLYAIQSNEPTNLNIGSLWIEVES